MTIIPEGRGKAEAARTFFATGGTRVSRGGSRDPGFLYTKGVLKGMTQEQAEAEFERRWAGASGAVKDNYAGMASPESVLAPSEMAQYRGPKPTAPKTPATPPPAGATTPRPAAPAPRDISNEPGVSGMIQGPPTPAVSAELANRPTTGPPAPAYAGPKINSLTGLPAGYMPGDPLPPNASQEMQKAAADHSAKVKQTDPSMSYAGPAAAPAPAPAPPSREPFSRSDGYKPRSDAEDRQRAQAATTARETGKMGSYFAGQGQPEMAKAFPDAADNARKLKKMGMTSDAPPRAMRVLAPEQYAAESRPRTGFALSRR
jgi:hypothetical protein